MAITVDPRIIEARLKRVTLEASALDTCGRSLGLLAATIAVSLSSAPSWASVLPEGGQITLGQATMTRSGDQLIIEQKTRDLSATWQSFSIGQGNRVTFNQPSAEAVAVNRVLGSDVSSIQGALESNGKVFLINPNGILFSKTAQVNVGALVASTLELGESEALTRKYNLKGSSAAAVMNHGSIMTRDEGGTVALVAARVVNTGTIETPKGSTIMAAGSKVLLDLGGPTQIEVEEGALNAWVEQGGAIRADSGMVFLTAKLAGALTQTVIKHTGTTEAKTMAVGEAPGKILLIGDMQHGKAEVGGTFDVSAPNSGDSGFVETSAARVSFFDTFQVKLNAPDGKPGNWLIDPYDFTIKNSGGDISATAIQTALGSGNVTIQTLDAGVNCVGIAGCGVGSFGGGDIFVEDDITWSSNKLTLNAYRNVLVYSNLDASAGGSLEVLFGQGTANGVGSQYRVSSGATVKIPLPTTSSNVSTTKFRWKKGSGGTLNDLVWNNGNLRFGPTLDKSVINSYGQLDQPYYFDNVTGGANFYKLTFSNFPLDLELGEGAGSNSRWNGNSGFVNTQGSFPITSGFLDISGYKPDQASSTGAVGIKGSGSIIATIRTTVNAKPVEIVNKYSLGPSDAFVKIDTTVRSTTSELSNVGLWVGTRDDFVASTDQPTKRAGNFLQGSFTQITSQGQASNVLKIDEQSSGTAGASILFYSTNAAARVTHSGCCSFTNSTSMNPSQVMPTAGGDGSYALYVGFGNMSVGQSSSLTWYYAAAPASLIGNVATSVDASAADALGVVYDFGRRVMRTYNGSPYLLTSVFPSTVLSNGRSVTAGTDYTFTFEGQQVTGFTNAGTYSDIGMTLTSNVTGVTLSQGSSGKGELYIAPKYLDLDGYQVATSKVYDGTAAATYITQPTLAAAIPKGTGTAFDGKPYTGDTINIVGLPVFNSSNVQTANSILLNSLSVDNSNYRLNIPANITSGISIQPRPITVNVASAQKVYGVSDPTFTYSIAADGQGTSRGLVNGDSLSGSLSRAAGTSVGTYAISANSLTNPNYAITSSDGLLTINPRPITVRANSASKVYGEADPTLTYSVALTSGGMDPAVLPGDSLVGSLSRAPGNTVGFYAISAEGLSNSNYQITPVGGTLTITQRPITVRANNATKTYGDNDPSFTYNVESGSIVGSDSLGTLTRTAGINVGSYTINASSLDNPNYALTRHNGTLMIQQRPINVRAEAKTKVYGQTDPALTYTVDPDGTSGSRGLAYSDTLAGSLSRNAGDNVGTYVINSGLSNSNYDITYVSSNLSITQRPIRVSAEVKTSVYGDSLASLTFAVDPVDANNASGLLAGHTVPGSLSSSVTSTSNVGEYGIDQGSVAAPNGNYALTFVPGIYRVSPRPVRVTAHSATAVYGEPLPQVNFTAETGTSSTGSGLLGADVMSGQPGVAASSSSPVGVYKITQGSLSVPSSNYALDFVGADFVIGKRMLFVSIDSAQKDYGDQDPGFGYSLDRLITGAGTGLLSRDSLGITYVRDQGEQVGSYSVDGQVSVSDNYFVIKFPGQLQINPRPVALAVTTVQKAYGEADPQLVYSIDTTAPGSKGLVGEDVLTINRVAGESAGRYAINLSHPANANYRLTASQDALVINPRPITVTANSTSKVYGEADPALTYAVALTSGGTGPAILPGDSLAGSLTRASGNTVGSYTIDPRGLTNPNYAITPVDGTLQITPRPVTVVADSKTKVYGDADPALTYTVSADGQGTSRGLVAGDSLDVSVSRAAGTNAGNYAVTASVASNLNYSVTTTDGSFTIAPRPVSLAVTTQTKAYGDADPSLSYTINPDGVAGSRGVVNNDSLIIARAVGTGAGSYAADISNPANSNYQISVDNPLLTITPRAITVTVDAKAKFYGDPDPALTYAVVADNGTTSRGLLQGDSLTGSLTRAVGNAAGTYAISTAGLTNPNYAITSSGGLLTINPRPITVVADAKTKVFGEADPQLTYTVLPNGSGTSRGLVTGDQLAVSLTRASGMNVGSYLISNSVAANPNYAITANNASFSITPRPVRVVARDLTRTFGEDNPVLTYTAERVQSGFARGLLTAEEQVTGLLATLATPTSPSGIYNITQGSLTPPSSNYVLEYEPGKLTVEPRVFAQANQAIQSVSTAVQAVVPVAGPSIGQLATSASVPIRSGAGQAPAAMQAPSSTPLAGGAGQAPATVEAPSSPSTSTTVAGGEGQQLAVQAPRTIAGGAGQSLGTIEAPTSLVPVAQGGAAGAAAGGVAVSGGSILVPASPAIAVAPATVGNLSVVAMDAGGGDVASAITAGGGAAAGLPRVFVTGGGISISAAPTPTSSTSDQ